MEDDFDCDFIKDESDDDRDGDPWMSWSIQTTITPQETQYIEWIFTKLMKDL